MSRPVIQISFKEDEMELYYKIQTRCKMLSKSGWIKEAMFEKLEREDNPQQYNEYIISDNHELQNIPLSNLNSFLNFN